MERTLRILEEGRTAWRIEHAHRVAFLVDGQAYYRAVAHAIAQARHSIFLLGWDVHSKIALLRGDDTDDLPAPLGPRFASLLARNPQLHVYVLDWDYAVFFAQERESRTRLLTDWPDSTRFHLSFDAFHPAGASHHQKVVLVDDSVVLTGGMDIGVGRWDSTRHLATDPRRSDPGFEDYVPAHDVMMMADDSVAHAMGELVRDRWSKATGEETVPMSARGLDRWPEAIEADATDVPIGISRTQPAHEDQQQVLEIERLHLAAIAAAERHIYIENQYLTCELVVEALANALQRENGPEIVIVLPQNNFGWFESRTIQVLHFRCIDRLRKTDRFHRLRVCYPTVPELGDQQINLHSKVFAIDDKILKIGSSNLTNRSMRLDTELDFSIETCGDRRLQDVIVGFRDRLLGEHLCMTPAEIECALHRNASLAALVDSRLEESRCLRIIVPDPEELEADIGDGTMIDPAEPITPEVVIETFAKPVVRINARARMLRVIALLVVCSVLAATWRWTPLREWIDPVALATLGAELREHSFAPVLVVTIYVLAGLLVLPVTVLILATAAVFGPLLGVAYSLAGSLASALFLFGIGRVAGRGTVESFTGRHFRRIAGALRNRGVLTMVTIRLLPVAPFSIVNMVVGATGIRARDFALGTLIGMTPGTVGLSLFQSQLEESVRRPGPGSLALLALVSAVIIGTLAWLRQRLRGGSRRGRGPLSAATANPSGS